MKTTLLNTVILAEHYESLRSWYCRVFELDILLELDKDYHYSDLGQGSDIIIGIGIASEMEKETGQKHSNHVLPQLLVDDLDLVISRVRSLGGKVIFGPAEDELYYYATIRDVEDNEIWLIQKVDD